MAKSRNRNPQRDTNAFADNLSLDASLLGGLSPLIDDFSSSPLTDISDGRLWHPDPPSRPSLLLDGRPTTRLELVDRPPSPAQKKLGYTLRSQTKAVLAFGDPDNTLVCVRRKTRREVMFAKRNFGRGRARARRRHWHSNVRC